ncbi:MAG: acyl-CoA dehydrogenase [Chromatiales bacterium]|jgi:indole-3-acetate monooxygenase|nr:acyl-CoA dehydrogenase [Chromatiales bacterium]
MSAQSPLAPSTSTHSPLEPYNTSSDDWHIQRARAVAPVLVDEAPQIESDRALSARALTAMHDARLFRLSLPHEFGGAQCSPAQLAQVTETISAADASAAWCLGQGLGCAMSAAFMDSEPAREVFGAHNSVLAWGAGNQGKAVLTDGGYRITGTWQFASGGKHATWLGAHCKVFEADGVTPKLNAAGKHAVRTALLPRDQADMADDWHVMGLRGTRSEGYTLTDLFVPAAYTLNRESQQECRQDGTLFIFPTTSVYAAAFSGVALGIARGALDDLRALATNKTARGARSSLKDSPVFHTELGQLEARYGAARAFQQQELNDIWQAVDATRELTLEQRGRIRLATTHAINEATVVVEKVYRLAGSTAIFQNQPFERRFRDSHAVSQQVQGRATNYETIGRLMMGLDVDMIFM